MMIVRTIAAKAHHRWSDRPPEILKRKKTGMILIKKKAAARRGTSDSGKGIILHALSVPQREENVKEVKV